MIRHGWLVHDVVEIVWEWCPGCCKSRAHEKYQGWLICLNGDCRYRTEPVEEQVGFQIEHFIKGEENEQPS